MLQVFINMSINRADTATSHLYARHLLNMSYSKFEDSSVRNLNQKLYPNMHPNSIVWDALGGLLTSALQLIGYSYIIASLHPLIVVFIFILSLLFHFIANSKEKIKYNFQDSKAKSERKFLYLFSTMIRFDFAKELRINKISDWLMHKYNKELSTYMTTYTKVEKKYLLLEILVCIISFAQTLGMYGYCAYQAIISKITVGDFTVYIGAITNFSSSLNGIIKNINELVFIAKYVDDYKHYMEIAVPLHLAKGAVDIPNSTTMHEIEFENVSFKYPNTEKYVLTNISLKIKTGEKLSIVGYNGAGKSTFIKLLCRLYEPSAGKILYNGVDISTIKYDQYIEGLSVVFQDYQIFAFSVADNIALNKPLDTERVLSAIEKSGLKPKIDTLPNGLKTSISREFDEDGIEFSGGEGQKLACARAYYKDGSIVILDEPTASLDPIAENELYERFNSIIGSKTAIYISHRLASATFCDTIAMFVNGEIVEYGTHDELMNDNKAYAEMFATQAQYYKAEEK